MGGQNSSKRPGRETEERRGATKTAAVSKVQVGVVGHAAAQDIELPVESSVDNHVDCL